MAKNTKNTKKIVKNLFFIFLIFLTISGLFALFFQPFEAIEEIPFSLVVEKINQGEIKKITVSGDDLLITQTDDVELKSRKESESSLSQSLTNYGADTEKIKAIELKTKEKGGILAWLGPLMMFLPLLLFILFFFFIFRSARGGANQTFSFLKAPAKLFAGKKSPSQKVSFRDIAGLQEAKEEIKEIVDFLRYPKKYLKMGARIPRGVLLVGPPGVGKTLLARAVANESGVPFFSIVGSAFIELFVGVGSSRVRHLFAEAKKSKASIVFIDEIDAIGKARMPGIGGGHEEREQTLNQILAEMDGFERDTGIIILAATNKPEVLDPALLRPGRFDRRIILDLPDIKGREAILKIHCQGKPLALDVKIREIAERTPGFSGADLANLVNEAAILAAKRNKEKIYQEELLESIEKVMLGPERKSHILSKKEKEVAAFHEAGHALVSSFLSKAEPIRKISIVARGTAAGYTLRLPSREKKMKTKSEFLAEIATLLGGYTAEKLKFGEITTGAGNDLQRASSLARSLVKEYGMSPLGPIVFGEKQQLSFLNKEFGENINYSEKVASEIDKQVAKFIKDGESQAKKILSKNKNVLERIAETLAIKETIEREEFEQLLNNEKKQLPSTQKSPKPLRKKEKSANIEPTLENLDIGVKIRNV